MRELKEADILRVMREEWNNKIKSLAEDVVGITMKAPTSDGKQESILAPDLKIFHKKSGIRYTIDSVGPRDVILRTPEGNNFLVDASTLERDYELG